MDSNNMVDPTNATSGAEKKPPVSPDIKKPDLPPRPEGNIGAVPLNTGTQNNLIPGLVNSMPTPTAPPKSPDPVPMPVKKISDPLASQKVLKEKRPINTKLIAIIVGAIVVIGIIAGAIYWYLTALRSIQIVIDSNEAIADVIVDGSVSQSVNIPYTTKVKAGTHTFAIAKEDFFGESTTLDISSTNSGETITLDLTEKQGILPVLEKETFFPVYNKKDNSLTYFLKNEAGYTLHKYLIATNIESTLISDPITVPIKKVTWSPTLKQLAIEVSNTPNPQEKLLPYLEEYGDSTVITWIIDLEKQDLVNVKAHYLHPSVQNVAFSPAGDKIVYYYNGAGGRNIATADNDGANYESIAQLQSTTFDPTLVWSNNGGMIIITPDPTEESDSKRDKDIKIYSFADRSGYQVTNNGKSFGGTLSPNDKSLVYESDGSLQALNIETLAKDKSEFAPTSLATNSTIALSVWLDNERLLTVADGGIWEININGDKKAFNYKESALPQDISEILLGTEELLIFSKQGIYSVGL